MPPDELLGAFHEPPDDAEELVQRLESLVDGPQAARRLASYGKRAVAPLRRFLLEGKPSGVFQPRQWAVEALAALGAKDVLVEYLTREQPIPDPVESYGEEAVVNTAARLLARWADDEAYAVLLNLLRRKAMPGAIDAVGGFRRAEALPLFIAALGDSIARTFAEEALLKAGSLAQQALVEAALSPLPSGAGETPTSRTRRRSALRLLAELGLPDGAWERLLPLMRSRDLEIAARACRFGLHSETPQERKAAARKLIRLFPGASCFLQMEMKHWLLEQPADALAEIERELALKGHSAAFGRIPQDPLLRLQAALVGLSRLQPKEASG
jgi:sugar phosphate isomerase/epimerase